MKWWASNIHSITDWAVWFKVKFVDPTQKNLDVSLDLQPHLKHKILRAFSLKWRENAWPYRHVRVIQKKKKKNSALKPSVFYYLYFLCIPDLWRKENKLHWAPFLPPPHKKLWNRYYRPIVQMRKWDSQSSFDNVWIKLHPKKKKA